MSRKIVAVWLSLAIMFGFIVIIVDIAPIVDAPTILYVGGSNPGNYSKIQDAINASKDGDTVFVYNGTYYENVVVNKTIDLIGENRESTIISGGGSEDSVHVSANWANVSDFTITGGGDFFVTDAGVGIYAQNCRVFNNNIYSNNLNGIFIGAYSNRNNITGNNISDNADYGIYLYCIPDPSYGNTISNNTISSNGDGIFSYYSHQNTILDNIFLKNGYGVILDDSNGWIINDNTIMNNNGHGIYLLGSDNNTISDNKISNNNDGINFYEGCWNNVISNDISNNNYYGITLFWGCMGNNISHNNVNSSNWTGIYIAHWSNWNNITGNMVSSNNLDGIVISDYSNENKVMGNIISSNNRSGIVMELSSGNNITGNNVFSNTENGIYFFHDSDWNNITCNTISNNSYGIYVQDDLSKNNSIYHNNFINNNNSNSPQVFDDNENQWDNGYPSGGNYWSDFDEPSEGAYDDYHGPEQDIFGSDGIVDKGIAAGGGRNPYVIDSDSQDNYPLMFSKYMYLYEGWNLISLPLIQSDTRLGSVLSSIEGSYDAVQWYNATDTLDPWKHNHTAKSQSLNDLHTLDHTMGFWIHIIESGGVIFEYSGALPMTSQGIQLHPGWNLVGYPSLTSHNRTDGLNNTKFGKDINVIYWYDASTRTWHNMQESDHFERGGGYWVHSREEVIWQVPL